MAMRTPPPEPHPTARHLRASAGGQRATGQGLGSGGAALAAGAIVVGAAALVPFRDLLGPEGVAILLVVGVIGAALDGGRRAGLAAAVVATLAFDFFHTEPYGSLTIASRRDVVLTALLGIVGVLVGGVAARSAVQRGRSARGDDEQRRIARTSHAVADGAPVDHIVAMVERDVTELLGLRGCRLATGDDGRTLTELDRSGSLAGVTHLVSTGARGGGWVLPAEGIAVPLVGTDARLVLDPDPSTGTTLDQRRTVVVLADLLALTLARGDATTDHADDAVSSAHEEETS